MMHADLIDQEDLRERLVAARPCYQMCARPFRGRYCRRWCRARTLLPVQPAPKIIRVGAAGRHSAMPANLAIAGMARSYRL